ncbi:MAG: AAA family ATPase [Acidimicrobiales bacterium]
MLLVLLGAYLAVLALNRPHVSGDRLNFTTFVAAVNDGRVHDARILDQDSVVTGTYQRPGGVVARYNAPLTTDLQSTVILRYLVPADIPTTIDQQVGKRIASLITLLLPGLIIAVLLGYLVLSHRRGTGLFAVRSGARRITADESPVRFTDIAGQDAAVGELREIRDFLTDPARFNAVGAAIPKGVLLYGPPGCGKTMLARALAGEADASFWSISGSDFIELYVGVGASRVRDLFREARQSAPALIFIDELDSIGRSRGRVGVMESHPEQEQALNQLLAEMDGFSTADGIIVVGATNRPDILDAALLRPGRFDRAIGLEKPDEDARLAILTTHARAKPLAPDVDLGAVAAMAHGMSGADLASVMNEAAVLAARTGRAAITRADLTAAVARIQEAPERRRRLSMRPAGIGRRLAGDDKVTFAEVAGQDAAVAELREIQEFLVEPERFRSLGAALPKGVLLYGPPGCGKTMLAKALASEAGAAFLSVESSEFVELVPGLGAARVRDLFAEARSMPPAIIFLDALDSIAQWGAAKAGRTASGDEEQTLNQILAEMDGFATRAGVIVIGASSRPDVLNPALLRPGRFDRTIGLALPDEAGRLAILAVNARGKSLGPDVDLAAVARRAYGLTGADLAAILNEAALLAGRRRLDAVTQADLLAATQRVLEAPDHQRRLSVRDRKVGRRFTGVDRVTFADVAGVDDAVGELVEVREYLTEPERFAAVGARVPRGVLLTGPPGCGKTMLGKALAGEAHAAFFSVSASELTGTSLGEGAARVRDLFADARSTAPSIVFMDEIEGLGGHRGNVGTHFERENTLNQLLVELDGFERREMVIVMAATNRPDLLDSALVRPGRFDRRITISLPDRAGRRAILDRYTRGKRVAADVDLDVLAGLTTGMSGADLENIVNEAVLFAARTHEDAVSRASFEEGIDRALLGLSSRATLLTDDERRLVALHELGHALVAMGLEHATPPHKVTIVPKGGGLGRCTTIDDHDRTVFSYSRLLDRMAVALGGWVAERMVLHEVGAGCAADLEYVGATARRMVREYGMSERMGPLRYPDTWDGTGMAPAYSSASVLAIDEEVRRIVDEATRRAQDVLTTRRAALDRMTDVLVEKETLGIRELHELAGTVRRVGAPAAPPTAAPGAAPGAGTAGAAPPGRRRWARQ